MCSLCHILEAEVMGTWTFSNFCCIYLKSYICCFWHLLQIIKINLLFPLTLAILSWLIPSLVCYLCSCFQMRRTLIHKSKCVHINFTQVNNFYLRKLLGQVHNFNRTFSMYLKILKSLTGEGWTKSFLNQSHNFWSVSYTTYCKICFDRWI